MNEVKWTKEQSCAIDTHGCNLLVAAGAGSGKTAVLVERIIKMIVHPTKGVDIDKLLVVTFTNAAASEMKERIAKALAKEMKKHPKSRRLQRQLTLLNKASITTIHSFCLQVIRSNFHTLDIDPSFRIGDETETILLKGEVIEKMFDEAYEDDNCSIEFLKLMECYSNNKDDLLLQNIVLNLYDFAMSSPYPKELLTKMAEEFNVDENYRFTESKWAKVLMEDIRIELQGLYKAMSNAKDVIEETEGLEPYKETFVEEINMIERLLLSCEKSWDDLFLEFANVKFKRLKSCKKCDDKIAQEKVKDIRNKVKKSINDDLKNKVVIYGGHETTLDLIELYPIMRELSNLVIEFIERYAKAKKERGIIDFNDFEHFCLSILTNKNEDGVVTSSKTALKLQEKYYEILVDEYQDSNDVQEAIINAIAKKKNGKSVNVFMVGDVKQSIYRFRQAKPEIFLNKYNTYSYEEDKLERKITLFKNFRSRREVIDSINFIFKQIMSKNVGEIEYNDEEALNLGAEYEKCIDEDAIISKDTELHILEKNEPIEEKINITEEDVPSNIEIEAKIVVKRINELINPKDGKVFKVFDNNIKKYRKIEYKDIVILLRSTTKWAPVFMEELRENLIPSYADTGSGYFETLEIKTMLSLLQIIDNPRQDIPLLAILRSPIASFTPEELIDIRLKDKDKEFFDVLKMAGEEESSIQNKCVSFLKNLKKWREKSLYMPIDEFIWYLYTDTGYYGYVGAMSSGIQRQANLKIFFQRARQYESTSYKGLFNFINFINKLKVSSGDMGSAKILGENENVVRIMSIHKSKGLEFPVVILSGLGKGFNMQDLNQKILFHGELGYGPDFVDISKRISYQTVLKQALKKKIKMETLSEEMRILYVALTRAKEKLILTGAVNSIQKSARKWSYSLDSCDEKLQEYEMLKARNYLDWICPAIIRHEDGKSLRKIIGIEEYQNKFLHDDSKWKINLYNKSELLINEENEKDEEIKEDKNELEKTPELSKYHDEIERRLNWKYDYIESSKMPTLLTVTEIKKMKNIELYQNESELIYTPKLSKKPSFLEKDKKLTGAEKGTAMHAVMQKLDYKVTLNYEEIKSQIEKMVAKELITCEQGECIDINKVIKFFSSGIGIRMLKSQRVYKEVPFHMELNAKEVYKNLPKEKYDKEKVILQGIIDCYFEEDDGIVLIDYKTDYFKNNEEEKIKDRYKVQLEYYKRAIEKISGKKVKEKYLYLFYNDSEIRI